VQVVQGPIDELGPAARPIEILDPEQEFAAAFARALVAKGSAVRMAKMQPSGRRRREPRHNHFGCDRNDS
jgi:hypothetical protein